MAVSGLPGSILGSHVPSEATPGTSWLARALAATGLGTFFILSPLLLILATGWDWMVGSLFALVGVTLVYTLLVVGQHTRHLDLPIAVALQRLQFPGLRRLVLVANWAGMAPEVMSAVAILSIGLALFGQPNDAWLVSMSIMLRPVARLLKDVCQLSRPTATQLVVRRIPKTASFPSAHVLAMTLVSGSLAFVLARAVAQPVVSLVCWVGAGLVLLVVGVSRVHVGSHWPSDVLGGYLWGACLLLLLVQIHARMP